MPKMRIAKNNTIKQNIRCSRSPLETIFSRGGWKIAHQSSTWQYSSHIPSLPRMRRVDMLIKGRIQNGPGREHSSRTLSNNDP